MTACRHRRRDAEAALSLGVVSPAARAAGIPEDVRAVSPPACEASTAALRRQAATQARTRAASTELLPPRILDRLLAAVRPAAGKPGRRIGDRRRPVEAARRDDRVVSATATASGASGCAPARTRAADRRVRDRGQSPDSAHQQELRALLRLRRPLLSLLRDLRSCARTTALPTSDRRRSLAVQPVDAAPATVEHELTLASGRR
jgi:hypothetical protein